jgi:Zn-finger nucleic acid-binding protein
VEVVLKNCPKCGSALAKKSRHGLEVDLCGSCNGMWLDRQELDELEDQAFTIGDEAKGTLVTKVEETQHKCPVCGGQLKAFRYRFHDLSIELCDKDGFWLDAAEDERILELMKKGEDDVARSMGAEEQWGRSLTRMRKGSFMDRVRRFFA